MAAKLTPIRVVCNNTLTMALGDKWSKTADVYVRHTKSASVQLEAAQRALGLVRVQAAKTAEAYQLLAATKLEAPREYFAEVFPKPAEPAGVLGNVDKGYTEKLERWEAHQRQVLALYQGGARGGDIPGVAGTLWAGYNAATEWIDHVYPILDSGKVSAIRQTSVLFGGYADVKARALSTALELADAGQ